MEIDIAYQRQISYISVKSRVGKINNEKNKDIKKNYYICKELALPVVEDREN
jgi:hypothetical protein